MFPIARNKILIRLENILDKFDVTNSGTKFFNLVQFSEDLWRSAQSEDIGNQQVYSLIEEMDISGTRRLKDMNQTEGWLTTNSLRENKQESDRNGY